MLPVLRPDTRGTKKNISVASCARACVAASDFYSPLFAEVVMAGRLDANLWTKYPFVKRPPQIPASHITTINLFALIPGVGDDVVIISRTFSRPGGGVTLVDPETVVCDHKVWVPKWFGQRPPKVAV